MPEAVVATFNIRHGRGLDGRVDLERTAAVIGRARPHLLALQEIDRFHPRSGKIDQPAELERLTGMRVLFVPTVVGDGWEYGIALATRAGDLSEPVGRALPRLGEDAEPRKALVSGWRGLHVVSTHLAVPPVLNRAQQEALVGIVAPLRPRVLVLGDLNVGGRNLTPLTELGLRAARTRGGTLHPWWRFKRIDHVLAGPGIELEGARTLPSGASDHRLVAVSLGWRVEEVTGVTYDA